MSTAERFGEAMLRSLRYLPGETAEALRGVLTAPNIALMAGTLAVWAGAHAFGIGLVADAILLAIGVATLGWSAFRLALVLWRFCDKAATARTDAELEEAAELFAEAVLLAGVAGISAVLTRRAAGSLRGELAAPATPVHRTALPVLRPDAANSCGGVALLYVATRFGLRRPFIEGWRSGQELQMELLAMFGGRRHWWALPDSSAGLARVLSGAPDGSLFIMGGRYRHLRGAHSGHFWVVEIRNGRAVHLDFNTGVYIDPLDFRAWGLIDANPITVLRQANLDAAGATAAL